MPDFSLPRGSETHKLPRMNCTALCMCAGLLSVASLQAGTQQIEAPQEGPVISFHLENDMFVWTSVN